jgi:hypothetical protein
VERRRQEAAAKDVEKRRAAYVQKQINDQVKEKGGWPRDYANLNKGLTSLPQQQSVKPADQMILSDDDSTNGANLQQPKFQPPPKSSTNQKA